MKRLLTFAVVLLAVACFQTTVFAQPPEAVDDSFTVHVAMVLDTGANDSGSATPYTIDQPSHGTVSTFQQPTRHLYTPDYGYVGPDSFTYRYCYNVQSEEVCTPLATVTIDRVNDAPITTESVYSVHWEGTIGPFVTGEGGDYDPDGDDLQVQNIVILTPPHLGFLTATPIGDIRNYSKSLLLPSGEDFFDYRICDSLGACSVGRVKIYVNDDPPVARNDFFILTGITRHLNLEANDYSPDGDPFDISPNDVTGFTQHGDLSPRAVLGDEDGFYYTRFWQTEPDFFGTDGFNYKIQEGGIGFLSEEARVTIMLIPLDDLEDAGVSCPRVGQPVNVTNGNMWLQQTDYSLPGTGENIDVTRTYNSIRQNMGLFGFGWSTKYDESLEFFTDDKMLRLNMPDGKAIYFGRSSSSEPFVAVSPDLVARIEQDPNDYTFTLTFKDGGSHKFSAAGKLLSQTDRNGNQTNLDYDMNGTLTSIGASFGRILNLSPNPDGRIEKISDSMGLIAQYKYSGGLLDTVTYADGSQYTFSYETINNREYLTTVRDVLGNVLESHEYDTLGRAKTSEKEGGVDRYTFDYTDPLKTKVTDALGNVSHYSFEKHRGKNLITEIEGVCACSGGGGSEVTSFTYDSHSNLIVKTDALGHQTKYKYDHNRNVIESEDTLTRKDKYTYNSLGQVLTHTDPMNGVTTNTYDSHGNLLTTTNPLNQTATFTYTSLGQIDTVKDPLNHTVTDVAYNIKGYPMQVKDAANNTTHLEFDSRVRLIQLTDAKGQETKFYYDLKNRIERMTLPDGFEIIYGYDSVGRRTSVTNEEGKTTTYGYDPTYRLTSITDPLGHSISFGYDPMSNMITQTNALSITTDLVYDEFNRLSEIIYPETPSHPTRLKETFRYDRMGSVIEQTNTAGRLTAYEYDDVDRLKKITDALGRFTHIEYNDRSEPLKVKDALNKEYTFTYDAAGQNLTETRDGRTMTYEYDAAGNRKKRIDFAGVVTNYGYDVLDRLTSIAYPVSSNYAAYGYDELSRLTSAENQNGTVSFTYNVRNWVESTTDVHGRVLEYAYDKTGKRIGLELDNNVHSTYVYDDASRLTDMTDESSANYSFEYDDANRIIGKTLPNGVVTTYTYDEMSRLTGLRHNSSGTNLADNTYLYNSANRIRKITAMNETRDFSYDDVNRLTGVTVSGNSVENYGYDDVGNRTSSHSNSFFQYGTRTIASDIFDYTFDFNGSLEGRVNHQDPNGTINVTPEPSVYRWDEENRLINTINSQGRGVSVDYSYDALGRRVKRAVDKSDEEKYTFDGNEIVLDDTGNSSLTYQNGSGTDNKLKAGASNQSQYFLQDHLGSTIAITDDQGQPIDSTGYDSFGNPTRPEISTRYQFTGREYDAESGLMYYRARWYNPQIGRFISEDPIGLGGGINQYSYTGNDPVNFTDPSGLYEIDVHYYLTLYLARKTKCFSSAQSLAIAEGNQMTDELEEYSPGPFKVLQNSTYHALHPGASPGRGSEDLWYYATRKGGNNSNLGRYMHYLQDTFSHEGYDSPDIGHLGGFHGTDKTNTDPGKAMQMAKSTFSALSDFARTMGCDCKPQWTTDMSMVIDEFNMAPGSETPNLNTIDSVGGGLDFYITNPGSYLERKRMILGMPRR